MPNHLDSPDHSSAEHQADSRTNESKPLDLGAEQAAAKAEHQATLTPRVELAQQAILAVAEGYPRMSRAEQAASAAQVDMSGHYANEHAARDMREFADNLSILVDQSMKTGQVAIAESPISRLEVESTSAGFPENGAWGRLNSELGTEYANPKDFAALLSSEITSVPDAPATNTAADYYGGQPYRQNEVIYLPTKDPGVLLAVTTENFTELAEWMGKNDTRITSPELTVGVIISPDAQGFTPLPKELVDKQQRTESARQQLKEHS